MVDYAAAIKKPFEDMQTAVIGIVIGAVSPLTLGLIGLLNMAFGLGVGRRAVKGDAKLPKWDPGQIVQYIKDIVFSAIIGIVYMIPAGILFAIGGAMAIGSVIAGLGGDPSIMASNVFGMIAAGGIFLIIGGILAIIGGIMASMGIMFYLKEGALGSAFKFGAIMKKVLTGTYLATLIVSVIYYGVLLIIVGVLSIIPILGSLIGLGILSYAGNVTMYSLFAQVFKETP